MLCLLEQCITVYCFYFIFYVNAGITLLNMMGLKWSAYHDISPTHVEKKNFTTVYFLQTFLYFHYQSFIYHYFAVM